MQVLKALLVVVLLGGLLVYVAQDWYAHEASSLTQQSQTTEVDDSDIDRSSRGFRDYADARKVFWQKLYPDEFTTLYCGEHHVRRPNRGINIEHVLPMGWVTNAMGCSTRDQCRSDPLFNRIESDLHNLYPTRTDVNKARQSFKFANIAGEVREFGTQCDFEVSQRQRAVEPRPEIRGDIARAVFYMVERYPTARIEVFAKQKKLLLEWHRADPPSPEERVRNATIESLQGNRNPYIDTPTLLGS